MIGNNARLERNVSFGMVLKLLINSFTHEGDTFPTSPIYSIMKAAHAPSLS